MRRIGTGLLLVAAVAAFLASAAHPVVVFDESHGQRFHIQGDAPLDLSGLAGLVGTRGGAPELWTRPLKAGTLHGVSALIISGPFRPIEEPEVTTITTFLKEGGRLAVMLHIAMPAALLLDRLGVKVSSRPVREKEDVLSGEPLNFEVSRLASHALTKGVGGFSVYGSFALKPLSPSATSLALTGAKAFIDMSSAGQSPASGVVDTYAVAVAGTFGKGQFAVFGDDALFQNQFLKGGNRKLAENLAAWLTEGKGAATGR